ncbi:CD1375 family protein [Lactobacillus hominis]|uniref:Uncharacterized protein n=1 Tax=Lactobacillus hominis DSM 23910 = CRBIP 24.179 TaxID=1423758 RepID=I7L9X0_9LACO|nr:CD1375 family protein [Lactobacillus hominis]KRM85730.1 hypothetical protein FC41_GL001045 [Lactobacillus hominis DSM 23910 = CRBIP 24.179]MCT3347223.1 hypothetical protein [Lactobacillus hominis]CCI81749.1 Putative uncharacterized protein [Lactobacillus hominis DSM 23910 = CRBIP 24.179]
MKKPSIRVIDYVVLVQSNVMTIEDVPSDIQGKVAEWLSFFVDGKKENNSETARGGLNAQNN